MSYLFCEVDCRKDMWQNHFANIVQGTRGFFLSLTHTILFYHIRIINITLYGHIIKFSITGYLDAVEPYVYS